MKRFVLVGLCVMFLAGCSSVPDDDLRTSAWHTEKVLAEANKVPAATQQGSAVEPRENTQK